MNEIERILYLVSVWENLISFAGCWIVVSIIAAIISLIGLYIAFQNGSDKIGWIKALTLSMISMAVMSLASTVIPSRVYLYTKLSYEMSQHPEASQHTIDWVNAQLEHEVYKLKLQHIKENVCK